MCVCLCARVCVLQYFFPVAAVARTMITSFAWEKHYLGPDCEFCPAHFGDPSLTTELKFVAQEEEDRIPEGGHEKVPGRWYERWILIKRTNTMGPDAEGTLQLMEMKEVWTWLDRQWIPKGSEPWKASNSMRLKKQYLKDARATRALEVRRANSRARAVWV